MKNLLTEKITALRKHFGYAQGDLARQLGVQVSEYMNWENGNSEPDIQMILKMSKFFEVNVDYFLGDTDEPDRNVENAFTEQTLIETVKNLPLAKKRALLILLQEKYL